MINIILSFCLCRRLRRCSALTSQKYLPTTYQAAWGGCACPVLTWISCFRILEESNYQLFSTYCSNYKDKFIETYTLYLSLKDLLLKTKTFRIWKLQLQNFGRRRFQMLRIWEFQNFSPKFQKMKNPNVKVQQKFKTSPPKIQFQNFRK